MNTVGTASASRASTTTNSCLWRFHLVTPPRDTRHLVDEAELGATPDDAVIVDTTRGWVVDGDVC